MSELHDSPHQDQHTVWVIAEQGFMRFLGIALMIAAVIGMVIGVFEVEETTQFTRTIDIATTLLIGAGSLWTLWWSNDKSRIHKLITDLQENGSGRTYLVMVVQIIIGGLFIGELFGGSLVLGLLGVIMLISAAFYFWRAQQISRVRKR